MTQSYDLTQLDSDAFEHMVNFLALKVLGNGITGFAAGPDGGKDGYIKGKAPYPTELESWEGTWYIQSKFHKPHLSSNEQKWLIKEVNKEIKEFEESNKRKIPDNWIIATNIEPTGLPQTGSYEVITKLVKKHFPNVNVDVWGGRKVIDYLMSHPSVSTTYGHFLTPGHILTELYKNIKKKEKTIKEIIDHLIVNQFREQSYTKLEQAGSGSDQRPKIYELFKDLPISTLDDGKNHFIMKSLVSTSNNVHKISAWKNFGAGWRDWSKVPTRARVLLLKGGPGQGKSTAGQYFSQIQKAAFILSENGPAVAPPLTEIALELKEHALQSGYWPSMPRIPIFVELKDYANWYIKQNENEAKNVIEYIYNKIKSKASFDLAPHIIRDALCISSWFVNFDGLDEVPNDLKDCIANEIIEFSNEITAQLDSDIFILCTTRPQGYSGQFESLDSSICNLQPLPREIALDCASAVVRYNRDEDEVEQSLKILENAMQSEQVTELMTTPLQSHIMAVVVRDGGRPVSIPARRTIHF